MDELRRLINGYQVSQAIHVAATLGIADLLADGPRTSDDLADATGSQPRALYRLLRALAAAGVLHEDENRTFTLSELGTHLRSDVAGSLHGWASFVGASVLLERVGAPGREHPERREHVPAGLRRKRSGSTGRSGPKRARSSTGR